VVVGGSAAGPKTAAKARRMDQHAEITIIQKAPDLSMASCGYPYYVGGVFDDRNQLLCTPTGVVRDPGFFLNAKGITAITETEVIGIDRAKKQVHCRKLADGSTFEVPYDKLVLATGAEPIMPPVPGADLEGITTLQSMRDADFLVDEFDRVDCGVDTTLEIECPECFATQEVDLPFDRTFFMPGRERTARRRDRSTSFPG